MTSGLTLAAILSMILAFGSGNTDLAKKAQQLQAVEQQRTAQLLQELQGVQNDLKARPVQQ